MNEKTASKTQIIVECALMLALGTVLAQIKLFRMPSGGSITLLSMAPFLLYSFRRGPKWGLLCGACNAALQMVLGGIYTPPAGTFFALFASVLLDYVFSYMVLGLAAPLGKIFCKKEGAGRVLAGTICCCLLRFVFSFLSGFLIWGSLTSGVWSALIYSLGYNASYMVPETILTAAGLLFLYKKAPALF